MKCVQVLENIDDGVAIAVDEWVEPKNLLKPTLILTKRDIIQDPWNPSISLVYTEPYKLQSLF
jgi:hypothetical protein